LAKWEEIKKVVEDLELDVTKNARGNSAAGVRARKGLRQIATHCRELVKLTIDLDKSEKEKE
jgi:hypothetical protein